MESQHYGTVLNEYSAHLQAEKGMAAATRESYLKAVGNCFALVMARPGDFLLPEGWGWGDLDKRAIEMYLHHLRERRGWKPGSVRQQLSALKVFFRFLQQRGYIARTPIKTLAPPPAPPVADPPQGEQQAVAGLFAAAPANLAQARSQAVAELIYGGGLRPSAAYRIRRLTLNKSGGTVRFQSGTAGEETSGEAPLSTAGLARMEAYLARRKEVLPAKGPRPFWVGERGAAAGPGQLARALRKAMEAAGLDGGGRALRQLSALHFRQRGGDVRSLQTFLKAKRLGRLDRYAAPDYQQVAKAFRRLHPRADPPDPGD